VAVAIRQLGNLATGLVKDSVDVNVVDVTMLLVVIDI
jgi:hypothetical protein